MIGHSEIPEQKVSPADSCDPWMRRYALDSLHALASHLHQTLNKVRSSHLFTFSEQSHAEAMVIEGAIHEAMTLEQQQQIVLKQVAEFTTSFVGSTSQMSKPGDASRAR
jgi:hypothetical protein